VVLQATLVNSDAEPIRVLRRAIGANGAAGNAFTVTRRGQPVARTHAMVKYAAPQPADYQTVPAGGTWVYTVDLSSAFAFTVTADYAIRLVAADPLLVLDTDGRVIATTLTSVTAVAVITGRPVEKAPAAASTARTTIGALSLATVGCSTGEQTTVTTSVADAGTYAGAAVQYFGDRRAGARYVQWFGAYDATRWERVQDNFEAADAVLDAGEITVVCHDALCAPSVFAFVYRTQPYTVYVCDAFWTAPATGTDSKAGTLIHEFMHFTAIAGTLDLAYGQTNASALAVSNPGNAVTNSDNYEYFAENTPLQEASGYTLSTTSVAFAGQTTGTSGSAATVQLTGSGDEALVVGTIEVSGDFAITANTCSGTTLAPAASCAISVVFSPTVAGARSGAVEIPSNAYMPLADIALSGTGVAPTPTPEPAPTATTAAAAAPTPSLRATTVLARGAKRSVVVTIGPTGSGIRRFTVQRRVGAAWRTLPGTFTTPGRRIVRVPKGTYRIVVAAADAYGGATSGAVTVRR
jgi:peptidyl-Lys metalloendopeptidase